MYFKNRGFHCRTKAMRTVLGAFSSAGILLGCGCTIWAKQACQINSVFDLCQMTHLLIDSMSSMSCMSRAMAHGNPLAGPMPKFFCLKTSITYSPQGGHPRGIRGQYKYPI